MQQILLLLFNLSLSCLFQAILLHQIVTVKRKEQCFIALCMLYIKIMLKLSLSCIQKFKRGLVLLVIFSIFKRTNILFDKINSIILVLCTMQMLDAFDYKPTLFKDIHSETLIRLIIRL